MDDIDPTNGESPINYLEEEPKVGNEAEGLFDAKQSQLEFLSGATQTKEVLKPDERLLPDTSPILIDGEAQSDADREKKKIESMLAKFPQEQQHVFDGRDGIECVYLGEGEISEELAKSVASAKDVLRSKFGEKLGDVFQGLKIYYVRGEIESAGWAFAHANAIVMDIDKNSLSIGEAEELLGPDGHGVLDKEDWQRVVADREGVDTISGETTLVHEVGHILQAKTGTKTEDPNAPTKYGKSNEWEDYAESFLYFCYDKPMEGNRTALIEQDIQLYTKAK